MKGAVSKTGKQLIKALPFYAMTRASGYRFFHILKALMLCTIIIVL